MFAEFRATIRADVEDARETIHSVRNGIRIREIILLFLVVPAVLLAVEAVIRTDFWVFAGYNRAYFRFPLTAESFWSLPILWKAFISSYGHDTFHPHLTGTLFMYPISMAALYPLSILADRKREFHAIAGFCFLVVPFVTSYQSLQNPMGRTAIGFSGVDGAFLGALPVMLLAAVNKQTDLGFVPLWSAGPVFLILAGLGVVAGVSRTVIGLSVGMALALGVLTFLYLGWDDLVQGLHLMTWPSNIFSWWGVTVAIAGPYLLFFSISPRTNIVGHLAGYFIGYVFALLVVWDMPELSRETLTLKSD